MQEQSKPHSERRRDKRLQLSAMYTAIRVRPSGARYYRWSGHIYDVSDAGLRFELDTAMKPGTCVDVKATLPGVDSVTVRLSGHVVRCHDEPDERGPVRLGMVVDSFPCAADGYRWLDYIDLHCLSQAA